MLRGKAFSMATVLMVEEEEQIRVRAESVLQEASHIDYRDGVEGPEGPLDTDQQIGPFFS